ncbi:AraC family transcriptional regulator [Uliginosibacterium paludis]|uniref:AraC family transcriptional regulator n=1 Tax=Uliginosibacterium paludis TaxID=1615952 RepID=A0ABV2CTK6_9RHOO
MTAPATPVRQRFWRDAALPFIEAREVSDGRSVCYDRHAHDTFSIGAITGGCCNYLNGAHRERADTGAVVLMNPGEVHACSPLAGTWSYLMLYIDCSWLGALQDEHGSAQGGGFRPLAEHLGTDPQHYQALRQLHAALISDDIALLEKDARLHAYFSRLVARAPLATHDDGIQTDPRLARAAEFIRASCHENLRLAVICREAGLSASYLIRAFKARYAMTPHEYLTNCRIQHCRARLRRGEPLARVATDAGFADQAHFQRAFKRHVAATPGEYCRV